MHSTACINTKSSTAFPAGKKCWRAYCRSKRREWNESRDGGQDRESGTVRGIHALSLPPIVGEESAALELRGALSAIVQRSAERQRGLDHADRMSGGGRFADRA